MTLQACEPFEWPSMEGVPSASSSSFGFAAVTFDSGTDRLAWVGNCRHTLTLDSVLVRTSTVTTGSTIEIRIETVTDGRPSGTLFATNTNGTVAIADSDDNVWKTVALTASASISPGTWFAIVIVNSSGTPNIAFASQTSAVLTFTGANTPFILQDTGAGTWAHSTRAMTWAVESSGVPVRLPALLPFAVSSTNITSASDPDEYAAKIVVPFKCRVVGVVVSLSNIAASGSFRVFLWDSSGDQESEALGDITIDSDFTASATVDGAHSYYFDTPIELAAGSTYYLGVRADTATNVTILRANTGETGAPADLYKALTSGAAMIGSNRTWSSINPGTAGAWSDDSTLIPLYRLIIDQLDDGAGGSGGGISRARAGSGLGS